MSVAYVAVMELLTEIVTVTEVSLTHSAYVEVIVLLTRIQMVSVTIRKSLDVPILQLVTMMKLRPLMMAAVHILSLDMIVMAYLLDVKGANLYSQLTFQITVCSVRKISPENVIQLLKQLILVQVKTSKYFVNTTKQ